MWLHVYESLRTYVVQMDWKEDAFDGGECNRAFGKAVSWALGSFRKQY